MIDRKYHTRHHFFLTLNSLSYNSEPSSGSLYDT